MQLYNKDILRLATRIGHQDALANAAYRIERRSRVCGSHLTICADMAEGKISGFSWSLSLCALGQAVAGIVSPHVLGLDREGFEKLARDIRHAAEGKPADASHPELNCLSVLKEHPRRAQSAMLPLEGLAALFDAAEGC